MENTGNTAPKKPIREIRINPVVPTESVLVATARSMRPKKEEPPAPHDARPHVDTCPFCRGNEDKTPAPIAVIPQEGNWQIRIVENMYPVLGDDSENPGFAFGLQQAFDGYGRHEVIIDNPSHGIRIHEMTDGHLGMLLAAYRGRMCRTSAWTLRGTTGIAMIWLWVWPMLAPAAGPKFLNTRTYLSRLLE